VEGENVMGPGEFGRSLHEFLEASLRLAPKEESELAGRLRDHLGGDVASLPILKRDIELRDQPNLQLALDNLEHADGWSIESIGISSTFGMIELGLSGLTSDAGLPRGMPRPEVGPVEYESVQLEPGRTIVCVVNALLLMRRGEERVAALLTRSQRMMGGGGLRLEVVAPEPEDGEALLARIGALMNEHNVYRGRVLAFARDEEGSVSVQIRGVPDVERESIVLPPGTLDRIELLALGPARHRERLLAAGRHLKRGVLLHGPPGTGKTTTAMYLVATMPGRTVLILTGEALGLVEPACALARELEPAMVVLEDVDLVAQERMFDESGPVLFELLNEMDGLAGDADVLFLLTTNRPDVLEPALAARPGRIDEAVELPLPDADGLRRLLALYSEGLDLRMSDVDAVVGRLEGATPAHVKELLRKAALIAAEQREGPIVVEDRHLLAALDDLSASIERIKQRLFAEDEPGEDDFPFPPDD
jgi:ATPase family associated with various cellular activities (AAA)